MLYRFFWSFGRLKRGFLRNGTDIFFFFFFFFFLKTFYSYLADYLLCFGTERIYQGISFTIKINVPCLQSIRVDSLKETALTNFRRCRTRTRHQIRVHTVIA